MLTGPVTLIPGHVTAAVVCGTCVGYTRSAVGTPATMTGADGGVTRFQYDAANRLTSLTNPSNETTTFSCDALNRLERQDKLAWIDAFGAEFGWQRPVASDRVETLAPVE